MENNITENTGINDAPGELGLSGSAQFLALNMMYSHGETLDDYRYTIAGLIENDDLMLGIAICAGGDCFCKAKGRAISSGRVLNQRKSIRGRNRIDLYTDKVPSSFKGQAGYPKDYFKGQEIKVFCAIVWHYRFFTKKELQQEFNLQK
jgi:hypothetical protein